MSGEVIFLEPVFKQMIWGGNRLHTKFGYEIPGDDTGECWAISAHPNGDCVVREGEFVGKHLSELWRDRRDIFGDATGEVFPLLTKIIDAKADLSIQVHPDDEYAREHENGSLGKTECWYVLDCEEDTTIVIGHHAKTRDELKNMIDEGRWTDLIREIPVKKGDFFQITPGTVHAIKGGTMILETQQNSDITYRLYDYDRLSNGRPRELHLKQSIDVIEVPYKPAVSDGKPIETKNPWLEELIHCDRYVVWHGKTSGAQSLTQDRKFLLVSVIDGDGTIGNKNIHKGDHFILPYDFGEAKLEGEMEVIVSSV